MLIKKIILSFHSQLPFLFLLLLYKFILLYYFTILLIFIHVEISFANYILEKFLQKMKEMIKKKVKTKNKKNKKRIIQKKKNLTSFGFVVTVLKNKIKSTFIGFTSDARTK